MFPCGHVHYSTSTSPEPTALQVLGSILPDAATTSAFGWTELHRSERVEDLARFVSDDPCLAPLITGVRHHLELDARSHDHWSGAGGYAYTVQTSELRALVKAALSCNDDRARVVAHNFIESACDIHIAATTNAAADLTLAFDSDAIERASTVVADWLNSDRGDMHERVLAFMELWRAPFTTIDGMTAAWLVTIPHLNVSAFEGSIGDVDAGAVRAGLELAVELVADSYEAVLTP
jgi:hypothetical protein